MPPEGKEHGASLPLLEMALASRTGHLLSRYGLRPVKSLGQNFLIDGNIADMLCAAVSELSPETVIEIGPGLGALTVCLGREGVRVFAIEKDPKLAAPLTELLASFDNVEVSIQDFLNADLSPYLGPETVVAGNLPYYITTPILEKLFSAGESFCGIVVTVQREVAQRIQAREGTREYGALTLFCRFYAQSIETVCQLSPSVFSPVPSVASTALRLIPRGANPEGVHSPEHFFAVVRAAFGYRRKTLRKALSTATGTCLDREGSAAVLSSAGIDPQRRGDTLSFEEFVALGNALATREARC